MVFGFFKKRKHPTLRELDDNVNYLQNLKKEGILTKNHVLPTGLKVYCYRPVISDDYDRNLLGYEKLNEVYAINYWASSKNEAMPESQYIRTIEGNNGSPFRYDEIVTKTVSGVRWLEGDGYQIYSDSSVEVNTKVYETSHFYLLERKNGRHPVYFLVEKDSLSIWKSKPTEFKSREERRRELFQKDEK